MKLTTMGTEMFPNDVAIILRPVFKDGDTVDNWSGNYQLLLAGFGPVTMSASDMEYLISAALLVSSAASFVEINKEFGDALVKHCQDHLGEQRDIPTIEAFTFTKQDSFDLNEDTKTHGGMQ